MIWSALHGNMKKTDNTVFVGVANQQSNTRHVVAVLTNGSKYEGTVTEKEYVLGVDVLNTDTPKCEAVAIMQQYLIDLGYDLGKYGADGDFGECTEIAVMKFQREHGCDADGEYGPITHAAMMEVLDAIENTDDGKIVRIEGGQCWIRTEPNTSCGRHEVAERGSEWPYGGEIAENGWLSIKYNDDQKAWVSNKYGILVQ